jgi:diacylglycerol kinase family enzyme
MSRLVVIANPKATRLSRRRVETVSSALQVDHKVEVELTRERGHATEIARDAVRDGADAIVVVGGDGTLAETFPVLAGGTVPVGVVPAGGANVLARSLGIPERTAPAVARLRLALTFAPRRIGLGRANDAWFGFVAGMGLDASAVRLVERRDRWKRMLGDVLYVACTIEALARCQGQPAALTIELPSGSEIGGIHHLMVANSSPYTYLGPIPLVLTPLAHVNRPLSVAGFRSISLGFTLRMLASAFCDARAIGRDPDAIVVNDLPRLTVRCSRPIDLQLDGDAQGRVTSVSYSWEPEALPFLL